MTRIVRLSMGWGVLSLVLAASLGCGGGSGIKKYTVTGTVTYDGMPVESGIIEFYIADSVKGGSNTSGAIKDGKFSVSDVSPGKNTVVVSPTGGSASAGPMTYDKMKNMGPAQAMKSGKAEAMAKNLREARGAGQALFPRDAPGNSQIFDITESRSIEIKILPSGKK
jgi:hypothetical protein